MNQKAILKMKLIKVSQKEYFKSFIFDIIYIIEDDTKQQSQTKRGQKSKLKKIKEKYKDQDEEERKLRMEILQSSGSAKDTKKGKKAKEIQLKNQRKNESKPPKVFVPKESNLEPAGGDDDDTTVQVDVDMIDALTGLPNEDDELLFAVPVIAPYNTLANYKYALQYFFSNHF